MYVNDKQNSTKLISEKENWKKGMTFPLPLYDLP